ncbi:MAG TPA: DUF308 domain-containing protein [Gemmatimonadales bacterium]|nr:DUF308 domain-containing protein [Gemmatimonadales bacterium]
MIPGQLAASVRHHWWLFLLRGIAALAFGLLTLLSPAATLVVLTAFIAAYALVDGIVALAYAFQLRPLFARWWVLLLQGLVSAAFGILAFMHPGLSLAYIVVSVSLWMLLASVVQFLLARVQKAMGASSVWSTLGGVLSLALAVAAIAYPGLTVAAVIALVAWFALVVGVVQLVVAFRVRSIAAAVA